MPQSFLNSLSIKQKFIALAMTLLLVVSVFIAWFFPLRQQREMSAYLNQKASVLAQVTAYGTASGVIFDDPAAVKTALDGLRSLPDVQFAFAFKPNGQQMGEVKANNGTPYAAEIAAMKTLTIQTVRELDNVSIVAQPIRVSNEANAEIAGTLVIALTREYLKEDVRRSVWIALAVSAAILLVGGSVFFWQTTWLVRPIQTLQAAAEHVSGNNLSIEAVPVVSRDEIGKLTMVFNQMVANLRGYIHQVESQAAQIQLSNAKLQENNLELATANEEIQRQVEIQAEQSREIELANSELNEKNLALDTAIQDLKLTQSQLVQSERMNAAGMLTAGVMHEVNNPNAAIIAAVGDVQETVSKMKEFFFSLLDERGKQSKKALQFGELSDDALSTLNIAMIGAKRVKGIVANLQSYTKHQRAGDYESTLKQEFASTAEIFRYQFKTVLVDVEIDETASSKGNFGELNQVFLNLLVNAAQAGASHIRIIGERLSSGAMAVRITDDGKGMPEEVKKRIFTPFFSTKGEGNSGLGLSISKQILDQHNIDISVESTPNVGTTFCLVFPSGELSLSQ
jgi:signal transduction histidine kinase